MHAHTRTRWHTSTVQRQPGKAGARGSPLNGTITHQKTLKPPTPPSSGPLARALTRSNNAPQVQLRIWCVHGTSRPGLQHHQLLKPPLRSPRTLPSQRNRSQAAPTEHSRSAPSWANHRRYHARLSTPPRGNHSADHHGRGSGNAGSVIRCGARPRCAARITLLRSDAVRCAPAADGCQALLTTQQALWMTTLPSRTRLARTGTSRCVCGIVTGFRKRRA
jgi:hypothetical protein